MKQCRVEHAGIDGEHLRARVYRKIGIGCVRERPNSGANAWTPERGERVLVWLGLAPLPTDADPVKFDPMQERHWSILMALAWGMWRTPDAVRTRWDSFCKASMEWGGIVRGKREYRQRRSGRVQTLKIAAIHEAAELHLEFGQVQSALVGSLEAGQIVATGRAPGQMRTAIPALEWADLTFVSGPDRFTDDTFAADARSGDRRYDSVRFARDDIVRLFAPIAEPRAKRRTTTSGEEKRAIEHYAGLLRANPRLTEVAARSALAAQGFEIGSEAWRRVRRDVRKEPGVHPARRGRPPKSPN